MRNRRGFTMVELLVSMVIFAVIGAAFTKLLSTQGRFFDHQGTANAARNVSRGSLNRVVSDFRMIEATGGVISADKKEMEIRVPFAIGIVCATAAGVTTVSLLPVDSVMYAQPGFYGYAWRSVTTGAYSYVEKPAGEAVGDAAVCTGKNITTLTGGKIVALTPALPVAATLGTPVLLYRRVKYEFDDSQTVIGKTGLFRTVIFQDGSEASEELVAPFASSAKFKFFSLNGVNATSNPPANLSDLRGIELHLDGLSEVTPRGQMGPQKAPFITAVYFKNRII